MPVDTSTTLGLILAVVFGFVFGVLLHRGGVANYNVIVNQFRFRDFTVLKIMFTAIVVGGIGVAALQGGGMAEWHIKQADMLGIVIGSALFGIGMVVYGYCPGTGIAAVATGSLHALVGLFGMLAGGIAYAYSFPWLRDHIFTIGKLGKVRLPEVTHVSQWVWYAALVGIAVVVFGLLEWIGPKDEKAS
jgi:uncharacterized membrane protein YedE/YeeE